MTGAGRDPALAAACALSAAPPAHALLPTSQVQVDKAVGGGSVNCPFPGRVASGGFAGNLGGLATSSLAPTSSLRAWSTIVDGKRYASTGTTHAVCVSADITLARSQAALTFSYIPKFISAATATCANPLARVVGGGFETGSASNTNPITASYPSEAAELDGARGGAVAARHPGGLRVRALQRAPPRCDDLPGIARRRCSATSAGWSTAGAGRAAWRSRASPTGRRGSVGGGAGRARG